MLDPRQELPAWISRAKLEQALSPHFKTATDAAADFLIVMHETIQGELIKRFGEPFVNQADIAYILTVPAVWSDAAKQATIRAAQQAGLGQCSHMISEPEAAAVYALSTMKGSGLQVGDVYIILDAGGGTVDLITYQVVNLQPLKFKEIVPGTGALCGSAMLNLRFETFVSNRLGAQRFQKLQREKPRAWAVAHEFFENYVKRNFTPSKNVHGLDEDEFAIPFPGIPDDTAARLESGFLLVTSAEIAEIFRPILQKIIALVEHQRVQAFNAGAPAKGVIMVGGFCQSPYLYSCLKQRFTDGIDLPPQYREAGQDDFDMELDVPPSYDQVVMYSRSTLPTRPSSNLPLTILQPANAWTAVVRGAVLRGLENKDLVSSRKARRYYGTVVAQPWDARIHDPKDKFWDDLLEGWYADNQMMWFVKKGETIRAGQAILKPIMSNSIEKLGKNTSSLYFCDADEAPTVFRKVPSSPVKLLCKLEYDEGQVPDQYHRIVRNASGIQYNRLNFDLGFHMESGRLKFDMRVDNIVYGEVYAQFE